MKSQNLKKIIDHTDLSKLPVSYTPKLKTSSTKIETYESDSDSDEVYKRICNKYNKFKSDRRKAILAKKTTNNY